MSKSGLMAKKIPTALGVLILIGGLVAGVILVNSRQGLLTKAGPTDAPKNVKISNKGSNTFNVSWTTDTPVTGFLKYSEDPTKMNTPAGDIRDQISGSTQSYTNHYVTVTGLNTNKTNYFMIGSGSQLYDDSGKPFEVRTGPQVIAPPQDIITGKVVGADGGAINNAIVYIEVQNGQTLSAMTKTDGTWSLNLALSRDSSGAVLTYDPATTLVSIFVQAGISGTATAITNTAKAKPVPDIILGKNQSFVDTTVATGSGTLTDSTVNSSGFKSITNEAVPILSPEGTEAGSMIITNPAINGEMIATSSPQFMGKTAAGTTIRITVHSPIELTQIIKADKNGAWSWTPPQELDPGVHTLTLEYTDENNVFQKVVRSFTVLAAEKTSGLPAFTATPSAGTVATKSATPSATPTLKPVMPATTSGNLADTGALNITILMGMLGVILFIFGRASKKWWRD